MVHRDRIQPSCVYLGVGGASGSKTGAETHVAASEAEFYEFGIETLVVGRGPGGDIRGPEGEVKGGEIEVAFWFVIRRYCRVGWVIMVVFSRIHIRFVGVMLAEILEALSLCLGAGEAFKVVCDQVGGGATVSEEDVWEVASCVSGADFVIVVPFDVVVEHKPEGDGVGA